MSDEKQNPDIESEVKRHPAPIEIPVEKVLGPLGGFAGSQATTGIVLVAAVILALAFANSGYRDVYLSLNHLPLAISLGDWRLQMSLHHWVNDGLMVFFFFILGLEIKREFLAGDLRDLRQSALVLLMALGGVLAPALIYVAVISITDSTAFSGWGIPMATDTAFALGILGLLGARAPAAATLMLTALAIVDDLVAVLVISLFYAEGLNPSALIGVGIALGMLALFNLAGARHPLFYLSGGLVLWWFILQSGVHATTAGILAALCVPARPYASTGWFQVRMTQIMRRFADADDPQQTILEQTRQHELAEQAKEVAVKSTTPLQRWEDTLDIPVSLAVLPLFVFLNAGVTLVGGEHMPGVAPVTMAITAGLAAGKALGITCFAWLGLRLGWCSLPRQMRFAHIVALGFLAGIGFTMSLFIAALAFGDQPQLLMNAKLGILGGSLIAAVAGVVLFLMNPPESGESD